MDWFVTVVTSAAIIVVILWLMLNIFVFPGRREIDFKSRDNASRAKPGAKIKSCPICGKILKPGENVKSAVYPGKKERLTHIFGCPFCYPPNTSYRRICPVCRKEVPREGYVIARMFETPGRKHVHVLGCSGCRAG